MDRAGRRRRAQLEELAARRSCCSACSISGSRRRCANWSACPADTGIIADDAMAGVYGALVLFVAGCFNLY